MKVSAVVLSALIAQGLAHYDPREAHAGVPKLIGARQFLSELKARMALPKAYSAPHVKERHPAHEQEANLENRQSTNRCGPNLGTCVASLCCSFEG